MEIVVFGNDFWNTYGIIRSLGEAGYRCSFINVCDGLSFVKHSRYIKKYWQVATEKEGLQLLLKNFGHGAEKDIVLCSSDETMGEIDANLNRLANGFVCFNCRDTEGEINRLISKDEMLKIAREVGLLVPQTVSLDLTSIPSAEELTELGVVFPCITKAESSLEGTKDNLCRCYNIAELINALKAAKQRGCNKVQVQEFVEKEYEMLITGWADGKGKVCIPGIIKKLSEYPMGFTALASIEPDTDKYIDAEKVKEYVRKTGFCGIFSVEFLLCKGKMYFMEINFRNDGNSYAPTPGGVNIHRDWVEAMMGKDVDDSRRIDREYMFQVEPNALNHHCFEGKGYPAFFKEFMGVDFRLICNWRDPMPGLYRFVFNKLRSRHG